MTLLDQLAALAEAADQLSRSATAISRIAREIVADAKRPADVPKRPKRKLALAPNPVALLDPKRDVPQEQLRDLREYVGLSQTAAAHLLGVAQSFISRIERMERRLPDITVAKIVDVYRDHKGKP